MSAGTAKTLVEALGKSGKIRRGGRIVDLPIGRGCREVDFGRGPRRAMPIPWGAVALAYYTTGIPNITVFTPISSPLLAIARMINAFGFIVQSPRLQAWLVEKIEKTVKGPDAAARDASRTWVWGEAKDPSVLSQTFESSDGNTAQKIAKRARVVLMSADGRGQRNQTPKPFTWTAKAKPILASHRRTKKAMAIVKAGCK